MPFRQVAADGPRWLGTARLGTWLTAIYTSLLVWGSLLPFSGWQPAVEPPWAFLGAPWPRYITRTDVLTNLFVYLPWGWLVARGLSLAGRSAGRAMAFTVTAALALSFTLESLQTFLPARDPSWLDWLLNAAGATAGSLMALAFARGTRLGEGVRGLREHWFACGRCADLGLLLGAVWVVAAAGAPMNQALAWPREALLPVLGLGALALLLLRPGHRRRLALVLALATAGGVLVRALVAGFEAAAAASAALAWLAAVVLLAPAVDAPDATRRRWAAGVLVLWSASVWLPGHPGNPLPNIAAFASTLPALWPPLTLAYLALSRLRPD